MNSHRYRDLDFLTDSVSTDTIDIWHGNIAEGDKLYRSNWRLLDEAEKIRAGKIKHVLQHERHVGIHGRLRRLLAQILNQAPEKIAIKKTEFGKPYLADYPALVFNLSHSDSIFLIAIGNNCQLGVDIERYKSRADLPALVNKCFAAEEITYWNRLPEARKKTEFYRFWTRKEAFVKATGRGLALGLKQCVINPENQAEFLRIPVDHVPALKWQIHEIDLGQDVCSALVVDKSIVGVRLMDLK